METLIGILASTFESITSTTAELAPSVIATLIVVVAGLIVASLVRRAMRGLLDAVQFDNLSDRAGLSAALKRADIEQSSSEILTTLVHWLVLVFTAAAALGTIGFADAAAFSAVGAMIPNVVIASMILVFGLNVCSFVSKLIQTTAVNARVRQARLMHNAVYFGMGTLVLFVALRRLGVPEPLLEQGSLILFGSTGLAMALAFGLGSREWAGDMVQNRIESERKQSDNLARASVIPVETAKRKVKSKKAA